MKQKLITFSQVTSMLLALFLMPLLVSCGDDDADVIDDGIEDVPEDVVVDKYNGHEYVDLGLASGTKWATCNVGATRPEDYGDYFAWGEIATKSTYTIDNCTTNGNDFTDISGNADYDAARANWGGEWRLPDAEDSTELMNDCTWTHITRNGVSGHLVIGPNGNSIFLPHAGQIVGSALQHAGIAGCIWSSVPYENDLAYYFLFYPDEIGFSGVGENGRYCGRSVRPVID